MKRCRECPLWESADNMSGICDSKLERAIGRLKFAGAGDISKAAISSVMRRNQRCDMAPYNARKLAREIHFNDAELVYGTCRDCIHHGFGTDGSHLCCQNLMYVEKVDPDMEQCEDFERRDI